MPPDPPTLSCAYNTHTCPAPSELPCIVYIFAPHPHQYLNGDSRPKIKHLVFVLNCCIWGVDRIFFFLFAASYLKKYAFVFRFFFASCQLGPALGRGQCLHHRVNGSKVVVLHCIRRSMASYSQERNHGAPTKVPSTWKSPSLCLTPTAALQISRRPAGVSVRRCFRAKRGYQNVVYIIGTVAIIYRAFW